MQPFDQHIFRNSAKAFYLIIWFAKLSSIGIMSNKILSLFKRFLYFQYILMFYTFIQWRILRGVQADPPYSAFVAKKFTFRAVFPLH